MKKLYLLLIALCSIGIANAQIINIPDANFKAKLLQADTSNTIAKDLSGNYFKIDADLDGEIEIAEASQVSFLNVLGSSISSLEGINYFNNIETLNCSYNAVNILDFSSLTSLVNLDCSYNIASVLNINGLLGLKMLDCSANHISSINLNGMINLEELKCQQTTLPSVDLTGLINLKRLYCGYNNFFSGVNLNGLVNLEEFYCGGAHLPSLDLAGLRNLKKVYIDRNQVQTLDLSDCTELTDLVCSSNNLSTLNLTGLTDLFYLDCDNNSINSLNFDGLSTLKVIYCGHNLLTSIDITQLPNVDRLDVSYNPFLTEILSKNGHQYFTLFFNDCPAMRYICAGERYIDYIKSQVIQYGYTNCTVNSYCSFNPGGIFYTITGNNKFDSNADGCDAADSFFSNLKFNFTDGVNNGVLIPNTSGNYSIPVQAGSHTITPVLENPSYFTVSPSNATVTFPTQASPFTQNFCITPNGSHPDLEISLLPIEVSRPGFDAIYKIIYKNKGNTTQSGTVNLNFNDAVLDLVLASPTETTQTVNNISWNFANLLPFETREISFTLNVNSPMETPPVNGGDVLTYTATIVSAATDEIPSDNTFVLNQTVVNSYDPNDKTCLEGTKIAPSEVGKYVHYMIRFENTGTYPAQNIVVKDMIDTNKFEISSLVPMKGSHSFVTNISAGNKVEFIFENINLPFDDANNDGYVAFKIKTVPTLANGDTFSNTASIYFDYNFPIVTNTATTTITALKNQDFEFSNYFRLYPNPVQDVLNIDVKETIAISSVSIYNTLGQLVLVVPNAQNTKTIDVSNLPSGNYFIKINTDKGTSNTKFIKQ